MNATENTASVTNREVIHAMRIIGNGNPELFRAMKIAEAMLIRLQGRADDARACMLLAAENIRKGELDSAIGNIEKSIQQVRHNQRELLSFDIPESLAEQVVRTF